ncbi:MAG TPA: catalase family peroxidase [Solirubrobacteraceae bacterium]|nr:catalase family peroxidase [Solirubrobacteraceae bacterium]
MGELEVQIVDAIQDVSGRHEGHRAVHAKGTLCAATFTPTPEAKDFCRAAHFLGGPVRAHVRFSNGSGNPHGRDASQDGRGIGVKLYLDDGTTTDLVGLSRRQFFVRTPEDFLEFTRARKPDPQTGQPDLEKLGAFLGAHPEAGPAVQEQLTSKPPVSYATTGFNGLHAFRYVAPDGTARWVRWHLEPAAGVQVIEDDEAAAARDRDYLQEEIAERLAQGPAVFVFSVAVAQEGDPIEDPTLAWPDDRETVELGRLEVTGIATDRERDGDILVFDPGRVTDGIEPSADPILNVRGDVYAESVYRRTGARR